MSTATIQLPLGTALHDQLSSASRFLEEGETGASTGILPTPLPAGASNGRVGMRSHTSTTQNQPLLAQSTTNLATEQSQEVLEEVGPLIRLTGGQSPLRQFKVLQQWEGIVTDLFEDALSADILDLTDPTKPREIVEIPLGEIPEADHDLLLPGCVFYWVIGYQISSGGQKSRISEIRLRRNPKWSQHGIETIKARGKALYQQFTQGKQVNPA